MTVRGFLTAIRRSVCSLVSVTIFCMPTWAFGTETNMSAIGKDAQRFAEQEAGTALANTPTLQGGNLTIKLGEGDTASFGTRELGSSNADIQTTWTADDIESLKGLFDGSDSDGTNKGNAAKEKLFGSDTTVEGQVHSLMVDSYNNRRTDYANETILSEAEEILKRYDLKDITDCRSDRVLTERGSTVHMPDIKECEQVLDRSGTCKITHDYRAGVIRYYAGNINNNLSCLDNPADRFNFESCGEGCTMVWLGKVGDNYINGGSCRLCEEEIHFTVVNPDAITKAELDYAAYDDQMQVWIGPKGKESKVYEGPTWGKFPYNDHDTGRTNVGCELGTHWIWDPYRNSFGCTEKSCRYTQENMPAIDITKHVKSAGKGGLVRFYLRDAIGGKGEAFARIKIYYDSSKAIVDDAWTPPECVQSAQAIDDGFAKGNYICTNMPAVGSNGCALIDGVYVCPHHLNKPPMKNISNLCMEASVKADFDFYKGSMGCWTDINGVEQCPTNEGGSLDKCSKLEEQGCQFISSTCTEGAKGASGICYVADSIYDCGYDVKVNDADIKTVSECSGDIKCTGEDCLTFKDESTQSFARVSALLNALQYMATDMDCAGVDENGTPTGQEDITCVAFAGNPRKCKIAVGGIQDCCENMNPVGMNPYLNMLMIKAGGAMMEGSFDGIGGAQNWLKEGADISYIEAVSPSEYLLAQQSGWENITANAHQAAEYVAHGAWSTAGMIESVGNVSWGVASYLNQMSSFVENINSWKDLWFPSIDVMLKHAITGIELYVRNALYNLFKKVAADLWAGAVGGTGGATGGGIMAGGGGGAAGGELVGGITEGMIGEDIVLEAGTEAAATAGSGAMAAVGAALGVVAAIYAAYCIAVMLIQSIYKCTEEEMELTAMRDVGSCHYIGSYCANKKLGVCIKKMRSYCCFNSPLSRIVQEQLRKQGDVLGADFSNFGSAKNPRCAGVPLEKIGLIDWDRVDLSEWTAILQNNQMFPSVDTVTINKLTGSESKYNYDGERVDSLTRNQSRMEYIDVTKEHQENDESVMINTGYTAKE